MASPGNILWATGGSVLINGAFLALLILTLPKTAALPQDDTLWVSLETAAAQAEGVAPPATKPTPPVPQAASQPVAASSPQAPAQLPSPKPAPKPTETPASTQASTPALAAPDKNPANSARPTANAAPTAATPAPISAPVQTGARPPAAAASGGSKHAASYAARVRAHIEGFKVYPPQARRRHQTGRVGFSFTIDRQGRILSARITKSSGIPALDQAALDMLSAAQPLPKPPSSLAGDSLGMNSVVEFGLTE